MRNRNSPYLKDIRVLLVEDAKATVEMLKRDIGKFLPGARVDAAGTVAEGRALLNAARAGGWSYDVAIIDYMLPLQHPAAAPAPDSFVHMEILKMSPGTIVIRVSAHDQDPFIRELHEQQDETNSEQVTFVPKSGDWIPTVIEAFVDAIHTRRIRQRLEALALPAGGRGPDAFRSRMLRRPGSGTSRSLAEAECCVDAAQHWESLPPSLQQHLKDCFGFAMIDNVPCLGVAEELEETTDDEATC